MARHENYDAPRITELGTIAELTAGSVALGGGDFLGMQADPPVGGEEDLFGGASA